MPMGKKRCIRTEGGRTDSLRMTTIQPGSADMVSDCVTFV